MQIAGVLRAGRRVYVGPSRCRVRGCTTNAAAHKCVSPILASERGVANSGGGHMAQLMYWPKIYLELGKFRLSGLVVATTASGYFMGATHMDPAVLGWTLSGTALAALSANSINQWIEIGNDSKMGRTMKRPLPSKRISPPHALAFGVSSGALGSAMLATQVNPLAGGLALSNILLYTGAYTPMKVQHPINTWIGAVVGGLPPLIGYAAATGGLDVTAGVLGAVLFSWQFPHFMALAHYCKKDYLAGGYKMLSDKRAAAVALRHSVYLMPMCISLPAMGVTTWAFGAESLLINGYMAHHALRFYQTPTIRTAKQLFRTSLWHLPALLILMALHRVTQEHTEGDSTESAVLPPPEESWIFPFPLQCTRYAIDEIVRGPAK